MLCCVVLCCVVLCCVHSLIDSKGVPRFKIIVEGANLFFTQDARLVLENAGVILYKDASANKGGVTSSSLEVLAALALDESEFMQHMAVTDPKNIPKFYSDYVTEIQQRIAQDADLEFECIWREHQRMCSPTDRFPSPFPLPVSCAHRCVVGCRHRHPPLFADRSGVEQDQCPERLRAELVAVPR